MRLTKRQFSHIFRIEGLTFIYSFILLILYRDDSVFYKYKALFYLLLNARTKPIQILYKSYTNRRFVFANTNLLTNLLTNPGLACKTSPVLVNRAYTNRRFVNAEGEICTCTCKKLLLALFLGLASNYKAYKAKLCISFVHLPHIS